MQFCARLFLLMLAATLPLTAHAERSAAVADLSSLGRSVSIHATPRLDGADDDTVAYEYGFEDGWSGWTTADLTETEPYWHTTDTHALEGRSWWCSDERLNGYDNHWLQYLDSPPLDLRDAREISLTFDVFWSVENPDIGQAPPDPYDGWDGCNLWVSTDGGDSWEVIDPITPRYTHSSLYSFGEEWGMGANIPGWCASSGNRGWPLGDWVAAEFSLSDYAGQGDVRVRWAFASDPGWATGDEGDPDRDCIGMLADNIEVVADGEMFWQNNGEEQGDMDITHGHGEPSGDFWEITDDDAHSGNFSAHCPIQPNLMNALVTPPIDIPEEGWFTHFEFWVRADTRAPFGPDTADNIIDDVFVVAISTDQLNWEWVVYDYGPDQQWWNDFRLYGPGTFDNNPGYPDWKINLDLTGFAGETVWLRWEFRTDDFMGGNQGTGLWIDDFQVSATSQADIDVGVSWLWVPYPTNFGFDAVCPFEVVNFGRTTQERIRKWWRIDDTRQNLVLPLDADVLEPGAAVEYSFTMDRKPYSGVVDVTVFTALNTDQRTVNDAVTVSGVVLYPEAVWVHGYDNRNPQTRLGFATDNGPAILVTPQDDGLAGNFDLNAIRAQWSAVEQNADADVTLHVYRDNNGRFGAELYSEDITVTPADLDPAVQVIDLTDADEVHGLGGNFWVWLEYHSDNGWPQVMGNSSTRSAGHNFISNGAAVEERDFEFQIQAVLMEAGAAGTELVAGRESMDFGDVPRNAPRAMPLTMFNGSTEPVVIEGVSISDNAFTLAGEIELPITLRVSEYYVLNVEFAPSEEREYSGEMTFMSNDEAPPVVSLLGVGAPPSSVPDEPPVSPYEFSLGAAFPNPFNQTAVIPFTLPRAGKASLTVYDLQGRLVWQLADGIFTPGSHQITLNAANLATGVYLYRLTADDLSAVQKVVMVK